MAAHAILTHHTQTCKGMVPTSTETSLGLGGRCSVSLPTSHFGKVSKRATRNPQTSTRNPQTSTRNPQPLDLQPLDPHQRTKCGSVAVLRPPSAPSGPLHEAVPRRGVQLVNALQDRVGRELRPCRLQRLQPIRGVPAASPREKPTLKVVAGCVVGGRRGRGPWRIAAAPFQSRKGLLNKNCRWRRHPNPNHCHRMHRAGQQVIT
jgi:hypothetical protein